MAQGRGPLRAAKTAAEVVGVVGVLIAGYVGVTAYIDGRVQKQLENPELLRAIAAEVRLALVFDSQNRILADQGALRYIDHLEFVRPQPGGPAELVVMPRQFLAVAPLLESLDEPGFNIEANRGKGIEWRYRLESGAIFESGTKNPRFRLEVIR